METPHLHKPENKGRTHSLSFFCHSANALLLLLPAFIVIICCTGRNQSQDILLPETDVCMKLHVKAEHVQTATAFKGNNMDIFIFNDDALRKIDSYQRTDAGDGMTVDAASRKGPKIVTAIVNPQAESYEWNSISSFESVAGLYADLRMENPDSPLMSGMMHIMADDDSEYCMHVEPVLSEIYVRSIKCDFSGRPYSHAVMENACAYLSNINSLATVISDGDFTPAAPVNTDGYPYESMNSMLHPGMVYAEFGTDIGHDVLKPEIRLYCYPNSSEEDTAGTPFTRLVIAGDIEGNRYYYPIDINNGEFVMETGHSGIGRNCRYVFDIVIRQTGVTDPSIPVSGETVVINGMIEPWNVLPETEIGF